MKEKYWGFGAGAANYKKILQYCQNYTICQKKYPDMQLLFPPVTNHHCPFSVDLVLAILKTCSLSPWPV